MATSRIKGITVKIGGDTTDLQKALRNVNNNIEDTRAKLKDVDKLLKLDPGNTELLAQQQKLLAQQLTNTRDKLKQLTEYAEAAKEALKMGQGSQENLDAIQRELISTKVDLEKLEDAAKQAEGGIEDLGDSSENSVTSLDTMKIAVGNLAAEIASKAVSALKDAVSYIGELAKTGLESYETLRAGKRTFQQLGETADQASAHVDELAEATLGLSVASADQVAYGQRMKASFNAITSEGTDYADIVNAITHGVVALNGSTEGLETAQTQLSQVFATGKMTQQDYNSIMGACPALLAELAKSMLGADATALDLKDALGDGTITLDQLADGLKNADVGAWAEQAGNASGNIGDLFTQMKQSVSNAFRDILDYGEEGNTVYDQLKTVISSLKDEISKVVDKIKTFLSEHEEQISSFMTFISEHIGLIIGVIATLAAIITTLTVVVTALTIAQMALNVVSAPVLGIIAAVIAVIALLVAAGVALYKNWDKIKEKAQELLDKMKATFNGIKDTVKGVVDKAKNWGRDLIQNLIDGITEKISALKNKVTNVASTISSYLHFSVPDKGPLADFDKSMPDMIDLMVKGIDDNQYKLTDAINGMATNMAVNPNGNITGSLSNIQSLLGQGNVIMLDTGELVGATAKSYNAEFGRMARLEAIR